jgi:phytoene desaturase
VKSVVIIGAGFGGLSAAATLAHKGYQVTVLEKNNLPGGRANLKKIKGYTFDMGPSWYLMPEVFERLYKELGTSVEKELELTKLSPSYRIIVDGQSIDIPDTKEELVALFESIETGSGKKLEAYLQTAQKHYEIAMQDFIYKKYTHLSDLFDIRLATEGIKLNIFGNLHAYVQKQFKDHRLQKILEYAMVFLGGSPKNTPAMYSLMSHVDLGQGVFYPTGGMHAVAQSLYTIAQTKGARFNFNETVEHISKDGVITTTTKKGTNTYKPDIIINNADYHHIDTQVLEEKEYSDTYWKSRTVAPSAFIMYIGVKKKISALEHHNLFLVKDWDQHFDQIFVHPKWPNNPSYYVCCPTKTQNDLAPQNKENLFFLVPVAPDLKDTPAVREKMKKQIITNFEEQIGEEISQDIEVCELFAHKDFSTLYNSFKGTALGLTHTLKQTALFRPRMKSKHNPNLYHIGQYTHPGVGVPMVIIAANIVTEMIINEY